MELILNIGHAFETLAVVGIFFLVVEVVLPYTDRLIRD